MERENWVYIKAMCVPSTAVITWHCWSASLNTEIILLRAPPSIFFAKRLKACRYVSVFYWISVTIGCSSFKKCFYRVTSS